MATVSLTPHLRRFFDLPDRVHVEAKTVADLVRMLDGRWPGLAFGTTSGNLYASTDGGREWTVVSQNLPAIYSVRFA